MQQYSLKNGLRVLIAPSDGSDTVTVLVYVRVGSRYEYPKLSGASHFIEHLLFKGTKRRPTAQHISRALDAVGAEFNAYTDKHVTGYYVKVDRKALDLSLDILSDMIFHSKFDVKELNRERQVVIEEINMYRDNPMRHVEDLLEEAAFTDSTLGWNIAGSPKSMTQMPRAEILAYHQAYYEPSNMVLVVSGHVDDRVKARIEHWFGGGRGVAKAPQPFEPYTDCHTSKTAPWVRLQTKQTEQIQLGIGFPSFGIGDERNEALNLLSIILGGNMSSRLFVQVRERRGLAYFVRAANQLYDDVGIFSIRAGLDKKRLKLAMQTIRKELRAITKIPVSVRELKEAKAFLRGQLSIRMEDTFNQAEWAARHALFEHSTLSPQGYLKRIEALTVTDLKHVAREVFDEKRMSLAVVGPYENREDFLKKAGL